MPKQTTSLDAVKTGLYDSMINIYLCLVMVHLQLHPQTNVYQLISDIHKGLLIDVKNRVKVNSPILKP